MSCVNDVNYRDTDKCVTHLKEREEKTYKQANKNVLFGIVHGSFVFVVLIVLFGHQWLVGVVDVVVVVAAMKTAG